MVRLRLFPPDSFDKDANSENPIQMKNMKNQLLLVTAFAFSVQLFAQNPAAVKYYEDSDYAMVLEELEDKPNPTKEELRMMAKSAVMIDDMARAEEFYNRLLTDNSVKIEDVFQYADVLRSQGKYEESVEWMEEFVDMAPEDTRAKRFEKDKSHYDELLSGNENFELIEVNINSPQIDFGPAYLGDQLVFSSSRYYGKTTKKKKSPEYLDMYLSIGDRSKGFEGVEPFHNKINEEYNEGPVAFDRAGEYMIITRNNYGKTDKDGVRRLKMFASTKKNGEWSKAKPLPWNDESYNVAHATLNPDGTVMYFASDMPGGQGGVDIYRSTRVKKGLWSEPINVGPPINTSGDELFPFIHESGVLAFASNGHLGLGGLDLFSAWVEDGPDALVLNFGAPVNSSADDFGMIFNQSLSSGYFSSNRKGGKGGDDIYAFDMNGLSKQRRVAGVVKGTGGQPLHNADVEIITADDNQIERMSTDESGEFDMLLEDQDDMTLKVTKEGYKQDIIELDNVTRNGVMKLNMVESSPDLKTIHADPKNKLTTYAGSSNKTHNAGSSSHIQTSKANNIRSSYAGADTAPNVSENGVTSPESNGKIGSASYSSSHRTAEAVVPSNRNYHASSRAYDMIPEVSASALAGLRPGDDLREVGIGPVYYEIDDMTIREDAHLDVFTLIDFLNANPAVKIEIQSYTDCRGWDKYNNRLSAERARFMAKWVKERVSSPERITYKGMGEKQLVNDCGCGFTDLNNNICSEDEHQLNRRTEFKLISK